MSYDPAAYKRQKEDPAWLERKRERDRKGKARERARDRTAALAKAKAWRDANKDKIAGYNRRHWEKTKADAEKLEQVRRKRRVNALSPEALEQKRARGRVNSRKKTRAALTEGKTVYEIETTPESRAKDTERMRRWRAANPERNKQVQARSRKTYKDRRGPRAAIDTYAQKALRMALVAADAQSIYFPGFTGKEFKAHIRKLMPNGWGFEDYGDKWEIDHIIPKSAFDYASVEDDQYKWCWSLENLRPCCKHENRKKGGLRRART